MKVGLLGSGAVAQALAAGFVQHGHDVMLGTRTPAKLAAWAADNRSVRIDGFSAAARFGQLIVLAVKGTAAREALELAGTDSLRGKIVVDATNPIADSAPVNGVLEFFTGPNESLMERLQKAFPECRFVKAFNSVGNACMVNPRFEGGPPTMFICGNDNAAKESVRVILDQFGWQAVDMGRVESARAIEPLCMLWCIPGFLRNDWVHAFKLLV